MKPLASNLTLSNAAISSVGMPHFGHEQCQNNFTRSPMIQQQKVQKISLQQYQLHQKLLLLQIQIQLQNVFALVRDKICSRLRIGLGRIRNQDREQLNYVKQNMVKQRMRLVVSKISHFVTQVRIKSLAKTFSTILLVSSFNSISYVADNNHAKKSKISNDRNNNEIVRAKSKNQQSLRLSDLRMQPQTQNTTELNPKKRNKQLRKQKVQLQRGLNDFYYKINNLLDEHEQILRKK